MLWDRVAPSPFLWGFLMKVMSDGLCGTAFKGVSQTGEASIVARLWTAEAATSGGGHGRGTRREGDVGGETLTTGPRHHSPSAWRPLSSRERWPTGPGQARQDSEKLLESSSRADDEAAAQDSGFRGRLVSEKGEKRPKDGGWGGEGVGTFHHEMKHQRRSRSEGR